MAAQDIYHDVVCDALENDGWTITDDPLILSVEGTTVKIDLGAEELLAAERNGRKIAVEIKSFLNPSPISDFHLALGQYLNYEYALEEREPERHLFLAVPSDAYDGFFVGHFAQQMIRRHGLRILVFDPDQKVIVKWDE
ncbi:MAG: element excision factor XisH family protein [Chloroflexota bacterium]